MDYKNIIESRYNREAWQQLLHDIFHNKVNFWTRPSEVRVSSRLAKQALNLGKISLADGESIAIYEVELTDNVDIERNRRGIRDMLTTDWRNMGYAGAFMFCYRKNESVLRFSYVSESWSFNKEGEYKKDSTDTRRFTYLLGEGHRSRTAIQQFEGLRKSNLTLKDLTKAFSVDAVGDMFFADYKQQYEDILAFITGKRMVKKGNKWEETVVGQPNNEIMSQFAAFGNPEKAVRDYVKKLMGRLVFLQFLQKKGWLGVPKDAEWGDGDREFVQHLFANCDDKDHFIDNVLEPLFNDINTERGGNIVSAAVGINIRVPYLNGGLFEPDAADATDFPLPEKYMQSMLDFFSSYNFTIDENDPDDAEMGVDPEMLGRIFENLLEDNKDKGAFYTPKEIVQYMCRESLIAYLQTDIEKEEQKEAIRQFVTTHQFVEHLPSDIPQMLKDVKICDPAIGSGAFPMGLLKELFLCRSALEGFDPKKSAEIKKHIIQQNIYGVDIEKGAVDIARLRFWLSLIVDEESPEALPNLDFKIMQGNSLLEQYKGIDLSNVTEKKADADGMISIFDDMLDVYRKELREKLEQYYNCANHKQKIVLRSEIANIVKKQIHEQGCDIDFGDIDLSGNDQFFLWHTWFHDVFSKGGFDIVIGNPPYVDIKSLPNNDVKLYFKLYGSTKNRMNLYAVFIENGINLKKENGVLCFINPNSLLMNESYSVLREMIVDAVDKIIKLPDSVFIQAVVETIIILIKNSNKESDIYGAVFKNDDKLDFNNISFSKFKRDVFKNDLDCKFNIFANPLFSNIISKMREGAKDLYYYVETSLGITPYDKYKGHDEATIKCRKFHSSYKVDSTYVPLISGANVSRYYITDDISEYLKYGEWLGAPRERRFFDKINIVVRQILSGDNLGIVAALSETPQFFTQIGFSLVDRNDDLDELKVILAILNSKLITFYHKNVFLDTEKKVFPKILIANAKKFPIKMPSDKSLMINLVDRILHDKKNNPLSDTTLLESEIDKLVYQLYGLTYDEVLIVDPMTSITREEFENNKTNVI